MSLPRTGCGLVCGLCLFLAVVVVSFVFWLSSSQGLWLVCCLCLFLVGLWVGLWSVSLFRGVVGWSLDDLLNIDSPYFEQMVRQIYPTELQLNKANSSDTEAPFLDLNLSITNGIVSSKIYDKRDDFNFEIVNFPFLDEDVPRSPSYSVYMSQLIRFARVCSNVDDFNNRNLFLTAKLLQQGYRYNKIRKAFSKFYHRLSDLMVKYNIGLNLFCNKAYQNLFFKVS